jgi:hypothetical protein
MRVCLFGLLSKITVAELTCHVPLKTTELIYGSTCEAAKQYYLLRGTELTFVQSNFRRDGVIASAIRNHHMLNKAEEVVVFTSTDHFRQRPMKTFLREVRLRKLTLKVVYLS